MTAPAERGGPLADRSRLRRHRQGSPGGVRDPADAARGQRDVPQGLYPFRPALVETLVPVSSHLQRERTAEGDAPDTGRPARDARPGRDRSGRRSLRRDCRGGRAVHREHAPPLRERPQPLPPEAPPAHREPAGIAKAEAETRPKNDKAARALRAEDRLAKTLLLSALAPEVEVLKNLTATRLAALNHRTPIEGREGQEVLRRCRAWAVEIGRSGSATTRPIRPSPSALGRRYREHPCRRRPVRRCRESAPPDPGRPCSTSSGLRIATSSCSTTRSPGAARNAASR